MASITLAEASKLGLPQLVAGIIDEIVTVDKMFSVLPFTEVYGNSHKYVREATMADAQVLGLGDAITARSGGTRTEVFAGLSRFVGDIEIDGQLLAQGVGSNAGNSLLETQIRAKAKAVAYAYQNQLINGDVAVDSKGFDGLRKLVTAGQTVTGGTLSFAKLDELASLVKTKGAQPDAFVMSMADILRLRALKRALGGASDSDQVMINGVNFEAYMGVPVLRNDWIKAAGAAGVEGTDIYAINFEDGTNSGVAGLVDQFGNMVQVEDVGASESKDEHIWRVKMYAGLALHSTLGLAAIKGVTA